MVERLYLKDSYLNEWDATIAGVIKKQGKIFVELDRTAFHPQGGGQPGDTGLIKTKNFSTKVVDTIDEGERILHQVDGIEEEGPVRCFLDFRRRTRFMVLHSGEHIFFRSLQLEIPELKVSKIALQESSGKLFVFGELDWDTVAKAEEVANKIIEEDRPVKIHSFSTLTEAKEKLPQARIKEERLKGAPRFIEVENFDYSACSGTHVASTGEIGCLKVFWLSRTGGETCIEYDVGRAAVRKSFQLSNIALKGAEALGTEPDKLVRTVENLKGQAEKLRSAVKTLSSEAGKQRFEQIKKNPKEVLGYRIFSADLTGLDQRDVIDLAKALQNEANSTTLLVGGIEKLVIVCARSKDTELDMRPVATAISTVLDGGCGGRSDFVTGSGTNVEKVPEALAAGEAEFTKVVSKQ